MKHILSTHLFASHRLTTVWFDRIWEAGIPAVEIFCARQHIDWSNHAQIREFAAWFRDSELTVHSLHAPMFTDEMWGRSGPRAVINITEPEKRKRIVMVDEIKRVLEIAEYVPFQYLIQHIGVGGEEYSEHKVDAAFNALDELSVFARQRGVEVLVENIPNGLASAERLLLFNELTHMKLNFCFDVGHANLKEGVGNAFNLLKNGIRSTHIHDNNGIEDQHLFPLESEGGTIDWRKTMALLKSQPNQYPLLLELKEIPGLANPIQAAGDVFHRLEELRPPEERE